MAHLHEPWFVLVGARQDRERCRGLVAKSVYSRLMGLLAETLKWERSGTVSVTRLAWARLSGDPWTGCDQSGQPVGLLEEGGAGWGGYVKDPGICMKPK